MEFTQEHFDQIVAKLKSGFSEEMKTLVGGLKGEELQQLVTNSKASAEQVEILKKSLSELSLDFKQWEEKRTANEFKSYYKQVGEFLKAHATEISNMAKGEKNSLELTLKAPEVITTGNAANGVTPDIMGVQIAAPDNVNLRQDSILNLVSTTSTNQAAYGYTETFPKEGDYAFVAEGEVKPQIDFSIQTQYVTPAKVAAWVKLTDESVQDIPRLQSIATDYLFKKHNRKKADFVLNGDVASGLQGVVDVSRTFVAGTLANTVENPNIMDVVNAAITDIYVTPNYEDEDPYMPSTALMNPVDFFLHFVSAKNADGLPLFPSASIFNRVTIGNVTIIPSLDVEEGKLFVCDLSKYNMTNYIPYTVKIGWINDDFIKNQFVILGESRFHAFVKNFDKAAFIYDDIAVIKTAIEKV